jgi:hypothetical protein
VAHLESVLLEHLKSFFLSNLDTLKGLRLGDDAFHLACDYRPLFLSQSAPAFAHVAVVIEAFLDRGPDGQVHAIQLLQGLTKDVRRRVPECLQR